MNDLSNVARMEYHYKKEGFVNSIYVEGIGTDDFEEDTDDVTDHLGVAYGAGRQGVEAKVKKGCQKLAEKVRILSGKKNVHTLTLDVFGFSRGSAAARYFVYQTSLKKERHLYRY